MIGNGDLTQVWVPEENKPWVGDVLLGAAGVLAGELPDLKLRPAGGLRSSKVVSEQGIFTGTYEEQLRIINPPAVLAKQRAEFPDADRVVVVLIDGMGWHNLQEKAKFAPFLTTAMAQSSAQTATPSTTAANVTFLGTGVLPGQTAMGGYTVRNPETGKQMNLISWAGGSDPLDWQRVPTVFERLNAAGLSHGHVSTWRFENSALTQAALRGSRFFAGESLSERVDATLAALTEAELDLVYLYWADLDATGHQYGWNTPQ